MSLIALQGISTTNKSIRLSGTFGLKLSDDDYEKILPPQGESVGSAKEFNWYVETPDGNVVEIINNAGNKTLTTSLSQWSTEVGIYKFYISAFTGDEGESIVADINVVGLSDGDDPNIIETLAPFVSTIENVIDGKVLYSNNNRLDSNNILRFY